LTHSI